jgi:hypothetical protein
MAINLKECNTNQWQLQNRVMVIIAATECTTTRAINRGKNNDGLSVINCGAMIPPKSGGQKDPKRHAAGKNTHGKKKWFLQYLKCVMMIERM